VNARLGIIMETWQYELAANLGKINVKLGGRK